MEFIEGIYVAQSRIGDMKQAIFDKLYGKGSKEKGTTNPETKG